MLWCEIAGPPQYANFSKFFSVLPAVDAKIDDVDMDMDIETDIVTDTDTDTDTDTGINMYITVT